MSVYVIADTHFGHEKIIQYEHRPFINTKEMDDVLIANWNNIVGRQDTIYHLGDFALTSAERIRELVGLLNGRKVLILGNHDRSKTDSFWLKAGFDRVFRSHLIFNGIVLSHEPVFINNKINVHGHTHSQNTGLDIRTYKCVSVERIDYKPIKLEDIVYE